MTTTAPIEGAPKKLAARRYKGSMYPIWFDDAACSRLKELHRHFATDLCIRPTNSVIVRAALEALERRIRDGYPAERLKSDLIAAAEARGIGR